MGWKCRTTGDGCQNWLWKCESWSWTTRMWTNYENAKSL